MKKRVESDTVEERGSAYHIGYQISAVDQKKGPSISTSLLRLLSFWRRASKLQRQDSAASRGQQSLKTLTSAVLFNLLYKYPVN